MPSWAVIGCVAVVAPALLSGALAGLVAMAYVLIPAVRPAGGVGRAVRTLALATAGLAAVGAGAFVAVLAALP